MGKIELTRFKKPSVEKLEIHLKGSKSYTNRALVLACLADGKSYLKNASDSDDTNLLINALNKIGYSVILNENTLEVEGGKKVREELKNNPKELLIDIGPAGTVMRFLTALISGTQGLTVTLSGSKRMHERPIASLVDALRQMGGDIEYLGTEGCPPLKIIGKHLKGGPVNLNGNISSQYFTALMLTASLYKEPLTIDVVGKQTSSSYIDMTESCLKAFNVKLENNSYTQYKISNTNTPQATDYLVEGDASGASYFWGLGALSGETIRVYNVAYHSTQGDVKFLDILSDMGCKINYSSHKSDETWTEVTGSKNLKAVNVNMDLLPDTAQTLAVIASFAEGVTKIEGLHTLRHKETDRIQALVTELKKSEIETNDTTDSLTIFGGKPKSTIYDTYEDHRMAMSFALMAVRLEDIQINDPEVVNKSFPTFFKELSRLGIESK